MCYIFFLAAVKSWVLIFWAKWGPWAIPPFLHQSWWHFFSICHVRTSSISKTDCCVDSSILALKPQPNDCNISTEHIATLLGTTCCVRLAILLRSVATCWVLKIALVRMPAGYNTVVRTWPNDHSIMQHPQMFDEKFGSISVSGQLRTYPSPNPTVTLTYYDMSGLGRGRCAVAQILILIHKSFIDQACSVKTAGY